MLELSQHLSTKSLKETMIDCFHAPQTLI